jgi:hypothetical protein
MMMRFKEMLDSFILFTVKSIFIWPGTGTGSVRIDPEKEMGAAGPPIRNEKKIYICIYINNNSIKF